jgi:hypothetical protein
MQSPAPHRRALDRVLLGRSHRRCARSVCAANGGHAWLWSQPPPLGGVLQGRRRLRCGRTRNYLHETCMWVNTAEAIRSFACAHILGWLCILRSLQFLMRLLLVTTGTALEASSAVWQADDVARCAARCGPGKVVGTMHHCAGCCRCLELIGQGSRRCSQGPSTVATEQVPVANGADLPAPHAAACSNASSSWQPLPLLVVTNLRSSGTGGSVCQPSCCFWPEHTLMYPACMFAISTLGN